MAGWESFSSTSRNCGMISSAIPCSVHHSVIVVWVPIRSGRVTAYGFKFLIQIHICGSPI